MKKYKVTFHYLNSVKHELNFDQNDVDRLLENIPKLRPGSTMDFGFSDNSRIFIRWDYVMEIEILEVSDE